MNGQLWEVIQLFKKKKELTIEDWIYAESVLEPEVVQLLALQRDGKMDIGSPGWK
ncbi:hypothetical protein [Lysinibacillus pakistanensis]|uniref:Uncharacterized protein n=1 Tax=Lysinibacillus pakistanensis TaxID=759811 RepID=A0AAX3WTY5_9BACI|nr:hypothetical protein [Lysinibacillus pakistanensis]MDM5230078.1 hypothetical protein [Lysinibacillus pakistanensis]QGG52885.1 hypothetical protein GDS87_19135 [Lysinibacillus pakistanensis]WHY45676.1 hypothetical protein QNH22_20730 [Lysinibacillus pakistanensis]WHY50684.1 hypothetical protein QNH24_20695 [Lysinibacillus pakistanensis]